MHTVLGIDLGIRNFSFCVLKKNSQVTILKWKVLDLCTLFFKSTSVKKISNNCVHEMFHCFLTSSEWNEILLCNVDEVVIEAQPRGKYTNARIVLFSHLLYEHFMTKLRTAHFGQRLSVVRFLAANSKYNAKWLKECNLEKEKRYLNRKRLSIQLCRELSQTRVTGDCDVAEVLNCAKADDLADSFLLALHAIEKH